VRTCGKTTGPAAGTADDEGEENMTNGDEVQHALVSFLRTAIDHATRG